MPPITPFKVLLFSKTSGYRHASIPAAITALHFLAQKSKLFETHATEDAEAAFTPSSLGQYAAIVLLHCTGDFLNPDQVEALKNFVRAGGGVVGIHGAAAAMLENEWYGKLVGAHFDSHPAPEHGRVVVEGQNRGHYLLDGCGERDGWMDEWYNFRDHPRANGGLNVLLKGDAASFSGGKMGDDHPLSWYQEFEGGRAFYTALGHFDEAYEDEWYMGQIFRAILWVAKAEEKRDLR